MIDLKPKSKQSVFPTDKHQTQLVLLFIGSYSLAVCVVVLAMLADTGCTVAYLIEIHKFTISEVVENVVNNPAVKHSPQDFGLRDLFRINLEQVLTKQDQVSFLSDFDAADLVLNPKHSCPAYHVGSYAFLQGQNLVHWRERRIIDP